MLFNRTLKEEEGKEVTDVLQWSKAMPSGESRIKGSQEVSSVPLSRPHLSQFEPDHSQPSTPVPPHLGSLKSEMQPMVGGKYSEIYIQLKIYTCVCAGGPWEIYVF